MNDQDLKQKLYAILDKWDESESEDYLTTEQTKFAMSLIDILCQQRAALEFVSMPLTRHNHTVESLLETIATDDAKAKEALAATDEALKAMGVE